MPIGGRNVMSCIGIFLMFARMSNGAATSCPDCGKAPIPYPLSTDDSCGDPNYRIYCNTDNNQLEFKSVDGIAYPIISIDPSSWRFVIRPPALASDSCTSADFGEGGLHLDENLPFNISTRNTVMLLNCTQRLLLSPLNCTSKSLCHHFEEEIEEAKACRDKLCCTYLKDTSYTSHRIRIHDGGCSAYTSVVNMNPALLPTEWNYGVEIQWVPALLKP